ncbi:MAG: 5-oxoprolinase subunit PxpA [Gammaproteobacteria bacterium]|nr:5-oxoprolinase subunit PxpA [Gammaproteobacteria bacterium]
MKLNCDIGESFGHWTIGLDQAVMPMIDMANIACGFHASDPDVMAQTIQAAIKHQVIIGAHPGYDDKAGFGRRTMACSLAEITHLVAYQVGAMQGMCALYGTTVSYVKPHGALYNDMMDNFDIFRAIIDGVASQTSQPTLMILASKDYQQYQQLAASQGVTLLFEAFADRAYTPQGKLVSRSQPGAVLHQVSDIIKQVVRLAETGEIVANDGSILTLKVDTVCVHGDNPESVACIKALKQALMS